MEVKLLDHTKLSNAVIGLRTCWDSFHKGGDYEEATDDITDVDMEFLDRVINKNRHESGAEFVQYIWQIKGISIGCQNQVVRHRTGSYLVRSTRYCKPENLVLSGDVDVDLIMIDALQRLSRLNVSNDIKKYAIPQGATTNMVIRMDARNFKHFLELRLDKHAHPEIRKLAERMQATIPDEHKFLFDRSE